MSRLIEGLESIKVLFDTKAKQSENAGYWKDFAGIIADAISTITEKTQRIENMETMIEDMEERIAIMSEGQIHAHWVLTGRKNVYGGIEVVCSHCTSTVMVSNVSDEKYCRTCGAMMDVPPKEGEAE